MSPSSNKKQPTSFLGYKDLATLLEHVAPFGCLDIGARGGVVEDILPLGWAASVYGFEPDEDECARLNRGSQREAGPFASVRFLPAALGAREERRTLHVTPVHPRCFRQIPTSPVGSGRAPLISTCNAASRSTPRRSMT